MKKRPTLQAGCIVALLIATIFLLGCRPDKSTEEIDQIKIFSGDNQYALPETDFARPLVITVNGPLKPGLFGGKGERNPVAHAELKAQVLPGSDLTITPESTTTDPGGAAHFTIRAGKRVGDHYLRIVPTAAPDLAVTVRFTVGAQISGGRQEAAVDSLAPRPVTIKLVNADGRAAANIPVYFKILGSPSGGNAGAEIIPETLHTNSEGEAAARIKLGNVSGEYQIGIEVADPASNYFMRQITVKMLALDLWKVIVNVLGGLALFVFGMKLMSDGLMKIAGDRMQKILQFFSRNGVVAVFAGTAVTAVIQSSSATTVMVIGFINAGLINLTQAIGIIFGANIGTTVTAQIISFNLGALAMPAIALGLLVSFAKKRTIRGWGESIFGFGLIFYGIGLMSSELKVLGVLPSFQHFFQLFDCTPAAGSLMPLGPVLGAIIIGTVLTMLVQSSSAAMGIVLALAGGGLIDFYTSVPLLLGTNIGTTITAFLASLAANRTAKQAALAHFLFNAFGTVFMVICFYIPYGEARVPIYLMLINAITPGDVFAEIPQNIERHIAMAHTLFNVANAMILLPFLRPFAQLCEYLIPGRADQEPPVRVLEPYLLATPTAALEQVVLAIRGMVRDSWRMIDAAVNEHFMKLNLDKNACEKLAEDEDKIDRMQASVTDYLVQITRRRNLTDHQSDLIPLLMHCTNDAERIADHTANILALTARLAKSDKKLSGASAKAIEKVWNILNNEAASVIEALDSTDAAEVRAALKSERKINKLTKEFEQENIDRLRKGSCSLVNSVIFIELLGELEKLGDHLTNIAERTPEIQKHYLNL